MATGMWVFEGVCDWGKGDPIEGAKHGLMAYSSHNLLSAAFSFYRFTGTFLPIIPHFILLFPYYGGANRDY